MNLLMLIIIFLALCVAGAIVYMAWSLTPKHPASDETQESGESSDSER